MKKYLNLTALLLVGISNVTWANAVNELQNRLNKIDVLSADYTQQVTDAQGKKYSKVVEKYNSNVLIYFVWTMKHLKKVKLLQMEKHYGSTILLLSK